MGVPLVLPVMPRSALPDVPAKFNLMLMDVPGPAGLPLANADWRIVRAQDADSALMISEKILTGTSDAEGKINLTADAEKQLKQAYDQTPNQLWVAYESQVRELVIAKESDGWSNTEKMNHALDAMGYSDSFGLVVDESSANFYAPTAKTEHKTSTADALLKKIKDA